MIGKSTAYSPLAQTCYPGQEIENCIVVWELMVSNLASMVSSIVETSETDCGSRSHCINREKYDYDTNNLKESALAGS